MDNIKIDVAVAGSGAAGMAAALTAAENGARVIIFEKNKFTGGISNFPKEIFAVESRLQRQLNIPFTKDDAFRVFMDRTHWKADARLVRAFVDKSSDTIDWLQKLGVSFEIHPQYLFPDGQLTAHDVRLPGGFVGLLKIMRAKAESIGVKIFLSTAVKKLIEEKGRITGVIVEDNSGKTTKVDLKAVIMACGGYPNDKEMVKKYNDLELGQDYKILTNVVLTGDGIRMAWEAGADCDGMAMAFRYGLPSQSGNPSRWDIFIITHQPYLWVNQHGQRFFDEGVYGSGGYTVNALMRQKNKCAYLIFDSNTKKYIEEESAGGPPRPDISSSSGIDDLVNRYMNKKTGEVFRAGTIEEIGKNTGINSAILQNTIDQYNSFCEKGHDDLFNKNHRYLHQVKQPPYFVFKIISIAYGTVGGIKINEKAEVINRADDVIPGLFAAGDCANGAISHDFWLAFGLRGNPSSFALNTGRIAGENAAK